VGPPLMMTSQDQSGSNHTSHELLASNGITWLTFPYDHYLPSCRELVSRESVAFNVLSAAGSPPQVAGDGGDIRTDETEAVRFKACLVEHVWLDPRMEQEQ
jgi:hypothetical protein